MGFLWLPFLFYMLVFLALDSVNDSIKLRTLSYGLLSVITGYNLGKKYRKGNENVILIAASFLLLSYVTYLNLSFLPRTEFPLQNIITLVYIIASIALFFQPNSYSIVLIVLGSVSMPLYYYYFHSFTLEQIPVLLFLLTYFYSRNFFRFDILFAVASIFFGFHLFSEFFSESSMHTYAEIFIFILLFNWFKNSEKTEREAACKIFILYFLVAQALLFIAILIRLPSVDYFPAKGYLLGVNANIYGGLTVLFVLPVIHLYRKTGNRVLKKILLPGFLVIAFNLFHIDSRMANWSVLVGIFLYTVLQQKHRKWYLAAGFAFAVSIFIYKIPSLEKITSLLERREIAGMFLENTYKYSMWTGFTPGNLVLNLSFPANYNRFNYYVPTGGVHSHNLLVQLFYSFGLIGVVLFAGILIYELMGVRFRKYLSLAIFLSIMFYSQIDFVFSLAGFSWFFAIVAGVLVSGTKNKELLFPGKTFTVFLFLVYFFISVNFLIFQNEAVIFRKNIVMNEFENTLVVPLKDRESLKKNENRFLGCEQYSYLNFTDYKKYQFEAEVFGMLYDETGKKTYLDKSLEKYNKCILKNKYATFCYYRLSFLLNQSGDSKKAEDVLLQARQLDPFYLLPLGRWH